MAILALDWGEKKVGVAITHEGEFAQSYATLTYFDEIELIEKIGKICKKEGVKKIVVGLPQTLRGEIGPQAKIIQGFIGRLGKKIKIPVITFDETLTTFEAKENLSAAGIPEKEIKQKLDEEAARIILQEYLDGLKK